MGTNGKLQKIAEIVVTVKAFVDFCKKYFQNFLIEVYNESAQVISNKLRMSNQIIHTTGFVN